MQCTMYIQLHHHEWEPGIDSKYSQTKLKLLVWWYICLKKVCPWRTLSLLRVSETGCLKRQRNDMQRYFSCICEGIYITGT